MTEISSQKQLQFKQLISRFVCVMTLKCLGWLLCQVLSIKTKFRPHPSELKRSLCLKKNQVLDFGTLMESKIAQVTNELKLLKLY